MESHGATWGARREVIYNATSALNELVECVSGAKLARSKIQVGVSFDEFNLDIDVRYDGEPIEFPSTRPAETHLLENEKGIARLAGYLVRQYADRVRSEVVGGRCRAQLHFDH
jgi:xanthine permease XanP